MLRPGGPGDKYRRAEPSTASREVCYGAPMMDDYAGAFDPGHGLASLSRRALAGLGREYMLFGHLLNRAALPIVHVRLGPQDREDVAIEEWMGASPIYSQRMQRAMRFEGDGVGTIMRNLQLDVGFAHQYMDVHYALDDETRGSFWLQRCGALLEVEPHGEAAVFSMCHAIEDPTFDATAVATNPRARCRPVHRPPRTPVDRVPHCRWEVFIDPDAEPVREIALTTRIRASRLAKLPASIVDGDNRGGWDDYAKPFVPDFHLGYLSHAALVIVCRELLMQNHLLVRALMMSVADRGGAAVAHDVGLAQWIGSGAVASRRLRAALGIPDDDVGAVLKVLQFHPAFLPGYADVRLERIAADRGRLSIGDCDALHEDDAMSWFGMLDAAPEPALDAMVQAVVPGARCLPATPSGGARFAWDVVADRGAPAAPERPEVAMVAATGTARFRFADPGIVG